MTLFSPTGLVEYSINDGAPRYFRIDKTVMLDEEHNIAVADWKGHLRRWLDKEHVNPAYRIFAWLDAHPS